MGSTFKKQLHQSDPGLEHVECSRDVREAMNAKNTASSEQLHQFSASRVEVSDPNEFDNVLVVVVGKQVN